MAVISQHLNRTGHSKRADLKRERYTYGALVKLAIASIAVESFGVELTRILHPSRGGLSITFARHVAMYLATIEGRLTLTETAVQFERNRRGVAYGIARLEERRDVDPPFDAAMDTIMLAFRDRLDALMAEHAFVLTTEVAS